MAQQRSACDRCRAHKVRCLPGSAACQRCERLDAECVTGRARPLGRPRRKASEKTEEAAKASEMVVNQFHQLNQGEVEQNGGQDNGRIMNGMFDLDWMMPDLSFDPILLPVLEGEEFAVHTHGSLDVFGSAASTLAQLNESLARQLTRSKSYPWGSPVSPEPGGVNGLVEIMRTTVELIDLIPRLYDSSELDNTPSTATVLLLLSTYLQVMEVYEAIFHGVYLTFCRTPTDQIGQCSGQADSQFHVAGIGAVQGPLRVKILIQVIEHHLSRLEVLLGVPHVFRLSAQVGSDELSSSGVLANASLIHAVMTESTGRPGESIILSLKDGIAKVKERIS
ncbi:hypothetical protein ASPZODRAFT_18653 [Penicilliopsis zonata CBS 506.65]|uniref:Zn(2)-C6 fungal-type domain-containing protein n=1 Tax=Penicilliopsis zonata CBS 506.65 TaxID=1073090 RepID=A0A1L9SBC5_9EURO|nr:hypothetical protein ASPZODRAFT_18653 [Penicilliopsis zonata CBS 506.65]OJJ44461.1 hypothetical protein ASPZODRAFT_18653 [Penicilliopsis zonata CBS 506.65]